MNAPCETVRWPTTREEAWRYFPTRALQGFLLHRPTGPGFEVVGELPPGVTTRLADVGDVVGDGGAGVDLPLDGLTEANHRYGQALVVDVAAGAKVPALVLRHVAPGDGVSHPRLVLRVGARAEVAVLERFEGGGAGFVNAATSVELGDGASLALTKLQVADATSSHVESLRVSVGRDARFKGFTLSLGAARARTAPTVVLGAPGGEVEVHGLYLGGGEQVLDHTAVLLHRAPHTTSRATWAGVLDGKATGTFQGLVTILPGAVKSKTRELTRTLLLSPTATANAKPELHIDVDDVEASHGAAIGTLDPAQLFYLEARGLGPDEARRMLVGAFVRATLELAPEVFRGALAAALGAHLGGEAGSQAGGHDDGEL